MTEMPGNALQSWLNLSEPDLSLLGRRCRCGVAVVRGRVYAVGGFNGSLRVRTVDQYDPTSDTWTSIASMEARRSTLGVAVFNDMIFAVGGFDGSCGLNTAELLDLSATGSQEWRPIASMSTRRSSVGVGVLQGLIFAVGGYDGNSRQCLASVEVYNPDQGESSLPPSLPGSNITLILQTCGVLCPRCLPVGAGLVSGSCTASSTAWAATTVRW